MALGSQVKALRGERGWSQTDLARQIGAAPAQISRYEAGRITPSADMIVRLAEAFDVSCDYLLVDDAPRRAFRSADDILGERLAYLALLGDEDRAALFAVIDGLVTRARLRQFTADIS
jgi:transcriptional regulator with XRE-family HTH domain